MIVNNKPAPLLPPRFPVPVSNDPHHPGGVVMTDLELKTLQEIINTIKKQQTLLEILAARNAAQLEHINALSKELAVWRKAHRWTPKSVID
jgi:hypothetical protein